MSQKKIYSSCIHTTLDTDFVSCDTDGSLYIITLPSEVNYKYFYKPYPEKVTEVHINIRTNNIRLYNKDKEIFDKTFEDSTRVNVLINQFCVEIN